MFPLDFSRFLEAVRLMTDDEAIEFCGQPYTTMIGWAKEDGVVIPAHILAEVAALETKTLQEENPSLQKSPELSQAVPVQIAPFPTGWQPVQGECMSWVQRGPHGSDRLVWGVECLNVTNYNDVQQWHMRPIAGSKAAGFFGIMSAYEPELVDFRPLPPYPRRAWDQLTDDYKSYIDGVPHVMGFGATLAAVRLVNHEVIPPLPDAWNPQEGDELFHVNARRTELLWGFRVRKREEGKATKQTVLWLTAIEGSEARQQFLSEDYDQMVYPNQLAKYRPASAQLIQVAPETHTPAPEKLKGKYLKGDYGTNDICGYTHEDDARKNAFLSDARSYIKAVFKELSGWETLDTHINKAGTAGSGEAHGLCFKPESWYGVYIDISAGIPVQHVSKVSPSGVQIMWRVTTIGDPYTGLKNQWEDWNTSAKDFADKLRDAVEAKHQQDFDQERADKREIWSIPLDEYCQSDRYDQIHRRYNDNGRKKGNAQTFYNHRYVEAYKERERLVDAHRYAIVRAVSEDKPVSRERLKEHRIEDYPANCRAKISGLLEGIPAVVEDWQPNVGDLAWFLTAEKKMVWGYKVQSKIVDDKTTHWGFSALPDSEAWKRYPRHKLVLQVGLDEFRPFSPETRELLPPDAPVPDDQAAAVPAHLLTAAEYADLSRRFPLYNAMKAAVKEEDKKRLAQQLEAVDADIEQKLEEHWQHVEAAWQRGEAVPPAVRKDYSDRLPARGGSTIQEERLTPAMSDVISLDDLRPDQATDAAEDEAIAPVLNEADQMGGFSRDTKALKRKRTEANREALLVLSSHDNETIRDTPDLRRQIAAYSGRGGTNVSSLNEYYTDLDICQFIWVMVRLLGFKKGVVLEPSCGTGNFIATAPDGFLVHGIEMDATSARIAQVLHGDRHRIENLTFQEFAQQDDEPKYHLCLGNPPFGPYVSTDLENANYLYKESSGKLEHCFILGGLRKLLPGGLLVYVIPHSIVGSQFDLSRRKLRELVTDWGGQFVGAFRLPNTAHKVAGTAFVTDIMIIRKLPSETVDYEGKQDFLNGTYFEQHNRKAFILGKEGEKCRWQHADGTKDMVYDVAGALTKEVWATARKLVSEKLRDWFEHFLSAKAVNAVQGDRVTLGDSEFALNSRWDWERVIGTTDFTLTPADFGVETFDDALDVLTAKWPDLTAAETTMFHNLVSYLEIPEEQNAGDSTETQNVNLTEIENNAVVIV